MGQQPQGEKIHPATPRKIQQQRDKGNVAKSQDLNSAFLLLVSFIGLSFLGPLAFSHLLKVMHHYLSDAAALRMESDNMQSFLIQGLIFMIPIILPLMVLIMVSGTLINIVQFGFMFSTQSLIPKFERLNPIKGFQRFFSMRSLVELIKSITKLTLIGWIAFMTIKGRLPELFLLMHESPEDGSGVAWELMAAIWWRIAAAIFVLGILDFAYQKWQHGQELKMTEQEMRDELKQYEGNPQIKQRIRAIQRQMSLNRMMADIPESDVVITNPTTYAVVLRYKPDQMDAPFVVAKGTRLIADRIRDIATEHNVPIVERPPLARALYRTLEVGQPVSEDLFRAVAEVLAYIYEIEQRENKIQERMAYQTAPVV